jgi:3-deoxy-7-phosphoheptulonate synthase
LKKAGLSPALMVDCSHANSSKQPERQEVVWQSVIAQRAAGNNSLIGLMVESNLQEGSQPFPQPAEKLLPGVSITDACISWETTARVLREGYEALAGKL